MVAVLLNYLQIYPCFHLLVITCLYLYCDEKRYIPEPIGNPEGEAPGIF